MSATQVVIIVIAVVIIAALAGYAVYTSRRRSLRRRFGPEYDRVVEERGSTAEAEKELRERERRHAELELHDLEPDVRERYATRWEEIQARFVDAPNDAVGEADELVSKLITERGYPTDNYEERLTHLSVDHANTLSHYRDAHEINVRNERGEASTEQLRQALVHYRSLFADLLGDAPQDATNR